MAQTIILITGANSGIGLASTKVLVQASPDYHVIIAARTLEKANAAVAEVSSLPNIKGSVSALLLDVTRVSSIAAAAAQVERDHGRVDVLVNNAGIGGLHIPDLKEAYDRVLETNVTGPALVSHYFRPLLLKSSNGYSVFISSGQRTLPRNCLVAPPETHANVGKAGYAYQVSKAALNMLAVTEARDQRPHGIKVFAVSPGFVVSNLRGPTEEERTGWGKAGEPEESGKLLLSIIKGERDADVGKLVHTEGVYEW